MSRLILICITATLVACTTTIGSSRMPGPDPKALWSQISHKDPYHQWQHWPDHQGIQPGSAPHGPRHKVFVNRPLLRSRQAPANAHSIAVKENYGLDGALKAITVMYKIPGYNPDAGDWFWAKYSPDGKAAVFGKPEGCINCHGAMAENDYVMVHGFSE